MKSGIPRRGPKQQREAIPCNKMRRSPRRGGAAATVLQCNEDAAPFTSPLCHPPQPVPMSTLLSLAVALLTALLTPVSCAAEQLPSVSVPRCTEDSPAALSALFLSNGSAPFPARTAISLCWTPDNLVAEFLCQDDPMLRNDFADCNSPMYNQVIRFAPRYAISAVRSEQCDTSAKLLNVWFCRKLWSYSSLRAVWMTRRITLKSRQRPSLRCTPPTSSTPLSTAASHTRSSTATPAE
jgi:hypothetical protein